ncbi:MAG: hydrogenase [Planctomycetes bacterium]|nr:hydrogenase [Planctomycetota bacterium]
MYFTVAAISIFLLGGLSSLIFGRRHGLCAFFGIGGAVAGAATAAVPAIIVLAGGSVDPISWPWSMPMGSFRLAMDGMSALFMLPVAILSGLAAIYGGAYLRHYRDKMQLGNSWFFFNLLAASMVTLVVARNGLLFLVAWEVMSLASFFLVMMENERADVRQAGWTYLVATHIGTAFLLVMFFLLGRAGNSMDFDAFAAGPMGNVIFLLAIIGFGTKAGFIPLHTWLPEAHPAAPSHVSAVMSGVMIKMGIYGLLRTLTFLPMPAEWWGWVLIGIGVTSGVLGVLLALAQHDLKRLLAYHSVENIGIIALGIGLGIVGLARGNAPLAVLGFAGGLLHVVNHAVFKALLFLGAGAVAHAAGTREIDRLGGLLKKMPQTAATFLIGSAAISALPPLNGFVSEFLIYLGSFQSAASSPADAAIPALIAIAGLALIGGLAAACFAKAFGVVFLGEPRSDCAAQAHEAPAAMRAAMIILAGCCVILGLLSPLAVPLMGPAVASASGLPLNVANQHLADAVSPLLWITFGAATFLALLAGLALLRKRLLAGRPVGQAGTWNCGYAAPTARMQYTASSFAQPLTDIFRIFLRTHKTGRDPQGLFPRNADLQTHTPDVFHDGLFRPAFLGVGWLMARLRWLQHGRLQLYVLYIVLTLLVLLVWKLG